MTPFKAVCTTGALLLGLALIASVASQANIPLPSRYVGFGIGSPSAPILLEFFGDLMCPDTKASWPVMEEVIAHFGPSNLYFIFHQFPLSYHTNAFTTAMGGVVVRNLTQSNDAFFCYANATFTNQALLSPPPTNLTSTDVINILAGFASGCGVDKSDFWDAYSGEDNGMTSGNAYNEEMRVAWKFACSRSVTGTPVFSVNGAMITDPNAAAYTVADWINLITPLLNDPAVTLHKEL